MIVVDASIIVDLFTAGEERVDSIKSTLSVNSSLHAPHLIDVEVAGAIRRGLLHGKIGEATAMTALKAMRDLPLDRYAHLPLMPRAWQLKESVTIGDAVYVSLAEMLGATFFTSDARLARAPGIRANVLTPTG
jgi:predicted nucleic acid-binding protein